MAVDLNALPAALDLPHAPNLRHWCLVVLLCSVLAGVLVAVFWPSTGWQSSSWFWCCASVLPLATGGALYGLRHHSYEKHRDYVLGWNLNHEEQKRVLVEKAQRPIVILDAAYRTGAGNHQVAALLTSGSKALRSLPGAGEQVRASPLPDSDAVAQKRYAERLAVYLEDILVELETVLARYQQNASLKVRIRHDPSTGQEEILSVWHACRGAQAIQDCVGFAPLDDGLLWMDAWLDEAQPCGLVLSLEFNLFLKPVADQAESVTAILLATPEWCVRHGATAKAFIHRPVKMADMQVALDTSLQWGRITEESRVNRVWHSQLSSDYLADLSIAARVAAVLPSLDSWLALNKSFGLPACTVGNIALILASEQARTDGGAQLVLLQDASPQACVVQPA
jgi:hypothetical protein